MARSSAELSGPLAQIPAAMLYVGLIALVFSLLPSLTVPVGGSLVGIGLVIGQFGGLFKFPEWLRNASPFTHTPAVDAADRVILIMAIDKVNAR